MFEAYVEGLRSAGWEGDRRAVRIAYAVQMALGSGLLESRPILRIALDPARRSWYEGVFGRPIDDILDRRAAIGAFLLDLGREACGLAGVSV